MRKLIALIMAMLVTLTFMGFVSAQGSLSGKSTLSLSKSSATLAPGSSLSVNYTMKLSNGTAGTTYLIIANGGQMSQDGIGVGTNPGSGTPPFNGTLNINITKSATAGTYNIVLETGGADPTNGPQNFTVTVTGNTVSKATTAATTSAASTSVAATTSVASSSLTTIAQSSGSTSGYGSSGALALVAILVIIVIAVIAIIVLRGKGSQGK